MIGFLATIFVSVVGLVIIGGVIKAIHNRYDMRHH